MTSLFFLHAEENSDNHALVEQVRSYCTDNRKQAYLIDRPLGDSRYDYGYDNALVLLMPQHKITFINLSTNESRFDEFVEDFTEDLASISDKFRYKDVIGRPRAWLDLIAKVDFTQTSFTIEELIEKTFIEAPNRQRVCAVSYTHLDVYKRQCPDCTVNGGQTCTPSLPTSPALLPA